MSEKPTPMPKVLVFGFGIYLIILTLVLLFVLVSIWPATIPPESDQAALESVGMLRMQLPIEIRYMLIVVVTGALGSSIHLITSFVDFVGNRQLVPSWGWWYILRPFIGMALALILYFTARGGLIISSAGASDLSPYGVAAIAGMAGMFSKQATDKLREVFENLFKTEKPPDRADKLRT